MHLLCFQYLSLTCGPERCAQVPVKNTRTSTTAWMWWRRCRFQTDLAFSAPWFETIRIWDVYTPGVVNFIIKCQLSLHLRLPKKKSSAFPFKDKMSTKLWLTATCTVTCCAKTPHDFLNFFQSADELFQLSTFISSDKPHTYADLTLLAVLGSCIIHANK